MMHGGDFRNEAHSAEAHNPLLRSIAIPGLWLLIILTSISIGVLNISLDGDLQTTLALIFIVLFVGLSILRPSVSMYVLVFLALAIEQKIWEYGWTKDIPYHRNLNSLFTSLKSLSINPMELHLLCIIAGLLIRFVITREKWVPVLEWKSVLLYFVSTIFFVGLGLMRGGVLLPALWEVRGIGYLLALMALVPQIIRTREQINHVIWAMVAGVLFRAIEVTYHYSEADFTLTGSVEGWGSHEDAGFFATMLVFTFAFWFLKVVDTKQKIVLSIVSVLFVLAIIGGGRRSTYPILAASLLLIVFLMPREFQKRMLKVMWKLGLVFALYLGIFWNSHSDNILLEPVQSIREGVGWDEEAEAGGSYSSNLYRKIENYDLLRMIRLRPIIGTGYGMLIDYTLPVPIAWDLGFYIPHNQILAVPVKTGVVGFVIFVNFYLSIVGGIASAFVRLKEDKYLHAVLVLISAAIVSHLVFSFFDIMLTYYRTNIFTGVLFGITSTIIAIERAQAKAEASPMSPQAKGNSFSTPSGWLLGTGTREESSVKA
jgi:O-antigen ligase